QYTDRVASLRGEVEQSSGAYLEATRLLAQIGEIESAAERLEKAEVLDRLVQDNGLGSLEGRSTRIYRDALVDNNRFDEAIDATGRISDRDPTDSLALGLCHFEKNNFVEAAENFNKVKPQVIRNSRYGATALQAAGQANLNANQPEWSFQCFSELKAKNAEDRRPVATVDNKLIEVCKLALRSTLKPEEERLWRTRWRELDPRQSENLRELMRVSYALGKAANKEGTPAGHDEAMRDFGDAYEALRAYLKDNGYDTLSDEDRKTADRLFACFADYVPLEPGTTYTYESEKTNTVRVVKRISGNSVDQLEVKVEVGGTEIPEKWVKTTGGMLIREVRGANRPLLISIPDPENTAHETSWGNQRVEITDIGQEVRASGERFQHCIVVRVYGGESNDAYKEYTLAPNVGIVREVNSANDDAYVLKSRS
ncbi:MAG: hypothetical protein KDC38_15715, partial [Planctomycetes bacterium]|nr:hypothetical protein [Planctomycetota bacterium]